MQFSFVCCRVPKGGNKYRQPRLGVFFPLTNKQQTCFVVEWERVHTFNQQVKVHALPGVLRKGTSPRLPMSSPSQHPPVSGVPISSLSTSPKGNSLVRGCSHKPQTGGICSKLIGLPEPTHTNPKATHLSALHGFNSMSPTRTPGSSLAASLQAIGGHLPTTWGHDPRRRLHVQEPYSRYKSHTPGTRATTPGTRAMTPGKKAMASNPQTIIHPPPPSTEDFPQISRSTGSERAKRLSLGCLLGDLPMGHPDQRLFSTNRQPEKEFGPIGKQKEPNPPRTPQTRFLSRSAGVMWTDIFYVGIGIGKLHPRERKTNQKDLMTLFNEVVLIILRPQATLFIGEMTSTSAWSLVEKERGPERRTNQNTGQQSTFAPFRAAELTCQTMH